MPHMIIKSKIVTHSHGGSSFNQVALRCIVRKNTAIILNPIQVSRTFHFMRAQRRKKAGQKGVALFRSCYLRPRPNPLQYRFYSSPVLHRSKRSDMDAAQAHVTFSPDQPYRYIIVVFNFGIVMVSVIGQDSNAVGLQHSRPVWSTDSGVETPEASVWSLGHGQSPVAKGLRDHQGAIQTLNTTNLFHSNTD